MPGQNWAASADGGYFANAKLSKKLRHAAQPMMKFRQFVRPVDGFGKGKGDTVDFNKLSNVGTQGGKINETQKMPETKFIIRRGTITVSEWGNSIPWTGKLETLSEFDLSNPVQKAMRDDMAKVLDKGVADVVKACKVVYTPTSPAAGTFNTSGSLTASGTNMNLFHLKEIVDKMIEDNVPPAVGGPEGDYVMIATQKAVRGIIDDPEFQEWTKYTESGKLLNGEIGKVYRCRIVVTTHTSALTKKNSNAMGEAVVLGDDSVIEAIALPEELRAKTPDDYGRSKGLAWYMLGDYALVWDYSTDTEYREIYVSTSTS